MDRLQTLPQPRRHHADARIATRPPIVRRPWRVTAALALLTSLAAPAQAQTPAGATVRIGIEGGYPPFSETQPDGRVTGFDIDVANALCAERSWRCTLVNLSFDGLIPALNGHQIDAVIASMSITDARLKYVDFAGPYYRSPSVLVGAAGLAVTVSPQGLTGRRIGVLTNTIQQCYIEATYPAAIIVPYDSLQNAALDLIAGRVDLVAGEIIAVTRGFLERPAGAGFAIKGQPFYEPHCMGIGAGIAVRKGDDQLKTDLNDALARLRADGRMAALSQRYFRAGELDTALDPPAAAPLSTTP